MALCRHKFLEKLSLDLLERKSTDLWGMGDNGVLSQDCLTSEHIMSWTHPGVFPKALVEITRIDMPSNWQHSNIRNFDTWIKIYHGRQGQVEAGRTTTCDN